MQVAGGMVSAAAAGTLQGLHTLPVCSSCMLAAAQKAVQQCVAWQHASWPGLLKCQLRLHQTPATAASVHARPAAFQPHPFAVPRPSGAHLMTRVPRDTQGARRTAAWPKTPAIQGSKARPRPSAKSFAPAHPSARSQAQSHGLTSSCIMLAQCDCDAPVRLQDASDAILSNCRREVRQPIQVSLPAIRKSFDAGKVDNVRGVGGRGVQVQGASPQPPAKCSRGAAAWSPVFRRANGPVRCLLSIS